MSDQGPNGLQDQEPEWLPKLPAIIQDRIDNYPDQAEMTRWKTEHPGAYMRPVEGVEGMFSLYLYDRDNDIEFVFGEFHRDELLLADTRWAKVEYPSTPRTNISELLAAALLEHPLFERISEWLEAGVKPQFRLMAPPPEIEHEADDGEPTCQVYMEHDDEFISVVRFPVTMLGGSVAPPDDPSTPSGLEG